MVAGGCGVEWRANSPEFHRPEAAIGFQYPISPSVTLRDVFYFVAADRGVETGKQHSVADAVNGLARDFSFLNGHGQIDPTFQQKLIEHILFAPPFDQVLRMVQKCLLQITSVGIPDADVAAVELEDFKGRCQSKLA